MKVIKFIALLPLYVLSFLGRLGHGMISVIGLMVFSDLFLHTFFIRELMYFLFRIL